MATSCFVCLEDYKGRVKPVICQYCPAHACGGCHQRYLLQSYEDPHCMSCKRGWSPEFMAASFTATFRSTALRLHRRKVLFEREKAVLPALQVYVEYKRMMGRLNPEIQALARELGSEWSKEPSNADSIAFRWRKTYDEHYRLTRVITRLRTDIQITKVKMEEDATAAAAGGPPALDRSAELRKFRYDLMEQKTLREETSRILGEIGPAYNEKKMRLGNLRGQYMMNDAAYNDRGGVVKERREFIMKCGGEDCRGFLSTSYKCGTCEKWTCQHCLVVIGADKEAEHICNPDTVESAKTIRSETRPCPKCGTRIFKIDGCDQMWCVMDGCGTAFSWNSGHIVTGVVHNPHYYEWLRRNGGGAPAREVGDIPCGGMPTILQIVRALNVVDIPNEMTTTIMETFRNMQDLLHVRLPGYPARMPQLIHKEDDVAYLMNELTEDEWKRKLEITEARFNRKKEIGQILQTLITAGSDMMNRLYERIRSIDSEINPDGFTGWLLDTAFPELEQLRAFGNESLLTLARRDKMAVPQLEENWKWKGIRALYRNKSAE